MYTDAYIYIRLNPFDLTLGLIRRDGGLSTLCRSCGFACQQRELKTYVSWPWLSPLQGWGSLAMAFTGKFVYIYI